MEGIAGAKSWDSLMTTRDAQLHGTAAFRAEV